ncbi:hypothetical protein V8C35DRAFT_327955 [Trichoderma chlorosporum]
MGPVMDNEQQMRQLLLLNKFEALGMLADGNKKKHLAALELFENGESEDEEPDDEYIPDLVARKSLFSRLQHVIVFNGLSLRPCATIFALFMVAPVDVLRSRVENLERWVRKDNQTEIQKFTADCRAAVAGVREFMETQERQIGKDAGENVLRSVKLCKKREWRMCKVTGNENPEAVPIFPLKGFANLWSLLDTFWGRETATRICALIRYEDILESPQNMMCLNRQLAWWFNNGKIAFKPVRVAETRSLAIEFHWLKRGNMVPADIITQSPNSFWAVASAPIGGRDSRCLVSGKSYSFYKTCGGIEPPSFELLQLSWDLLRAAAICGATNPVELGDESSSGDDSSDEDYVEGCEEGYGDEDDEDEDEDEDDDENDDMKSQPDMGNEMQYTEEPEEDDLDRRQNMLNRLRDFYFQ